jgi:hypothetical protein
MVENSEAFRLYSPIAIQSWKVLKNSVEEQRKLRNQPSWAKDFEWFYIESTRYRKKNYPDENPDLYLRP